MNRTLTQTIGSNIKNARQELKLNQQSLADKAEITQAALRCIEQGERNPSIRTLEALAKALKVSASYLLSKNGMSETLKNHKE